MGLPSQNDHQSIFSNDPSEALEEMMAQYGSLVLKTAFFYVKDRYIAEDVSQEAFIRAFKNWKKFKGNSSVKTWLVKITINICYDKLRKKSSKEEPIDHTQVSIRNQFNLEQEVIKRMDKSEILKYVLRLPEHYQEVIYLYYYLEFNTIEIAKATDTPEGTVRTRLTRARSQIAEYLKKEGLMDDGSK